MKTEIVQDFTFEAAHYLPQVPRGHRCHRVHGHSYRVSLVLCGPIREPEGWILDFGDVEGVFFPVLDKLDHHLLNEVEGLSNPTAEHIATWIWQRVKPLLPELCRIEVWETPTSRAIVAE